MVIQGLLLLLLTSGEQPRDFQTNQRLGELYIARRQFARALPYLESAYSINPHDYANAFDLVTLYLQLKDTAKARAVLTGLLAQGDKGELHNLLGDIEEAEGHVDEAARQYEIAARLDPSEKNLFDLGSDILSHRGFEPALKVFYFAKTQYPKSARLRVGLGVTHYSLGQYDEAVADLCEAVDLNPRDPKAFDFLGKMYDISVQYADEVSSRLEHFVQAYPESAVANYYYALSLRKRSLGGPKIALSKVEALLRKAILIDPSFADAHYELGLVLEDRKAMTGAITQYQAVIQLQPSHEKAHYRLARLYAKTGREVQAKQEFSVVERLKSLR